MKKIICLLSFIATFNVNAAWTPFHTISYTQINTSGDYFVWLQGHSNASGVNPGGCDYSVFKIKKGDTGYELFKEQLNMGFFQSKKVRVNVVSSCHDTHRYKRFNTVQFKAQ